LDEEDVDDEIGEVDLHDGVNMPGAWDLPPHQRGKSVNSVSGRATSLPGLGPTSKTNAFRLPPSKPTAAYRPGSVFGLAPAPITTSSASASAPAPVSAAASQSQPTVNIRTLDAETLQKRVVEKQKELEQTRKEMEKMEKLWNKKSKDIGRWREGLIKA